ncbi:hypothetical protein F2P81_009987 [Scophthalmus maximus]|uniref:Uncharacterized protein n=1 Tax=Scophthalmus maximus TaxID=52904 RepID=A0A6A4ST30_SCOMX|nr:hypothetical protein F2P81_009987 [Scophthalmus maximus]
MPERPLRHETHKRGGKNPRTERGLAVKMLVYVFSLLRISRLSDITPPVLQTWCQLLQQFFKLSRRTT